MERCLYINTRKYIKFLLDLHNFLKKLYKIKKVPHSLGSRDQKLINLLYFIFNNIIGSFYRLFNIFYFTSAALSLKSVSSPAAFNMLKRFINNFIHIDL